MLCIHHYLRYWFPLMILLLFMFRGTLNIWEQLYLLSGKFSGVRISQQYVYSSDIGGRDHLNGMRVCFTCTMDGTSSLAVQLIKCRTSDPFIIDLGFKREENYLGERLLISYPIMWPICAVSLYHTNTSVPCIKNESNREIKLIINIVADIEVKK